MSKNLANAPGIFTWLFFRIASAEDGVMTSRGNVTRRRRLMRSISDVFKRSRSKRKFRRQVACELFHFALSRVCTSYPSVACGLRRQRVRVECTCFTFQGDFTASDITMPEQDRVKLLVMVKEGRISVDDVIDVVSVCVAV